MGCINKISRYENNTDCGYLFSGKYTIEEVNLIKDIVINCKTHAKLTDCYNEKYNINFEENKAAVIINTPFFNTLKTIDLKERTYESYSDSDIIIGLNSNVLDLLLVYDTSLGVFEKALFKSNSQIYNLEDVSLDYSLSYEYGYNKRALRYNSLSNFINESVEFIFLIKKNNVIKEFSVIIDLNNYK